MSKRKFLNCCIFVIGGLIVGAAFVTATNYLQLGIAILLYPLLGYFLLKAFPRGVREVDPLKPTVKSVERLENETTTNNKDRLSIADIDKRAFLKLIGGAGLSLFLFSIFNKKAEGLFFKNLPNAGRISLEDSNGNKINPAQNHPTDGYRISEIDDSDITLYGFTNIDGAWFIMRQDTDTGTFRYAKGNVDFPGSWNNREHLKYDYYNNVF